MKKHLLWGVIFIFLMVFQAYGQSDITISGKITDEKGEPVPGASVYVKNKKNIGTITDATGNYTLSGVPANATLVITAVGLQTQEVAVNNQSTIEVKMKDESAIDEVVVTAIGIKRQPKELGYSVTQIKSENLNQAKAINSAVGLSGKVAGLQINTVSSGVNPSTRVVLRGNRSLTGNNEALVVLDGSVVPQSVLTFLNPNDIESINVLKGANAAAVYGSDAANGVLIVTTKKGSDKFSATVSHTNMAERVSFLPEFQNQFGQGTEPFSRTYIPFENQSFGPAFGSGSIVDQNGNVYDNGTVVVGKQLEDGTFQRIPYTALPDEKKRVWDTGNMMQTEVSLSGGSKNSKFYLSFQDLNQKGVVPKDQYRRNSFRLNANTETEKLRAGFNVNYTQARTNVHYAESRVGTTNPPGYGLDRDKSFYWLVINSAANIPLTKYRNWQGIKNADGSMNYGNPNNYFNDYYNNPWFELDNNRLDRKDDYITANAELTYKFTPWLNATYRVGTTNQNTFSKAYSDKFDYSAWASDSAHINRAKDYAGRVRDVSSYSYRVSQDFFVTATKKWNKISGNLILGSNIFDNTSKFTSIEATGLVIPGLFNVNNRIGEAAVDEASSTARRIGAFADLTIGYNGYLFLHASGRNDWDSRLAASQRSFFYPSVDLSFVLSDAIEGLKDNKTLTFAKITAAATKVGNVNINPYQLQTVFNGGAGFPYGDLAGFSVGNNLLDPKLKPEFLTSYEVGIELGFLERLNLELSYYTQKATDQTVSIAVSPATGYSNATINTGQVDNSGFESTLRGTILNTKGGFRWDVNLNYAYRDNKVASLYQGLDEIALSNVDGDGTISAITGQQYPALKVTSYKRDPQGRVIVDQDGYPIEDAGFKVVGQTNPKHLLGVGTTLSYKGFTLSALAEYRAGNVIYHATGHNLVFTGVAAVTANYNRDRFIFPNSVIEVKDAAGNVTGYQPNTSLAVKDGGLGFWDDHYDGIGENFVTSAAFWKLREVNLTYQLPASWIERSKYFKGASISFIGRNLLMLLPKANKYTDPELSTTSGNAQGANNIFNTPPTRMYGFNLTLNF